jgi:nicotinate-nucleotide--dimethylbenzimidazole phosphoribosyltransferase
VTARPPAPADNDIAGQLGQIDPLDEAAMALARDRLDRLTKPPGSLGRLEAIAVQLAGIRGIPVTTIARPVVVVFAGDHGITRRGVSPYPAEVTRQMLANFAGGGAAINVLARAAGAGLTVVDVGVAGLPIEGVTAAGTRLLHRRVADGTRDFSTEPAMTADEVRAAIDVGRRTIEELVDDGADLVALGEMGIGNTTSASAVVAALTGRPASEVTGAGTGLDTAGVRRKAATIDAALRRHRVGHDAPSDALRTFGGLEIAALVGGLVAAGERNVPVLLDGFITGAAALVGARLAPRLQARLIASHRSTEPGHRIVLDELGLEPLLDLGLRLGEATGAALAIPIVVASARLLGEMATFDSAGISDRD